MSQLLDCSHCGQSFPLPRERMGRGYPCPHCGVTIFVPFPETTAPQGSSPVPTPASPSVEQHSDGERGGTLGTLLLILGVLAVATLGCIVVTVTAYLLLR